MGIDILGIDIMGVDIVGIDIPAPTQLYTVSRPVLYMCILHYCIINVYMYTYFILFKYINV